MSPVMPLVPLHKKSKKKFTVFSKQNVSLLRRQARGCSLTCRRSCLSSPFTRKENFGHSSDRNKSLLRRQAGDFSLTLSPVMPLISLHNKEKRVGLCFSAIMTGSLLRRQAGGLFPHTTPLAGADIGTKRTSAQKPLAVTLELKQLCAACSAGLAEVCSEQACLERADLLCNRA